MFFRDASTIEPKPCDSPRMARRKRDLTPEQNAAVRELARGLVFPNGEYSQASFGDLVGIGQSNVSKFIDPKSTSGTSFPAALKICQLAGVDGLELLDLYVTTVAPAKSVKLPGLRRVFEVMSKGGYGRATVAYVNMLAKYWRADRIHGDWMQMVEDFDEAHRSVPPAIALVPDPPAKSTVRAKRKPAKRRRRAK